MNLIQRFTIKKLKNVRNDINVDACFCLAS